MKEWFKGFWQRHGERIIFGGLAFLGALFLNYALGLGKQAETVFIGLVMLFYNKARTGEQAEK